MSKTYILIKLFYLLKYRFFNVILNITFVFI